MRIVRLSDEQRLRHLYAFRYAIFVDELEWLLPRCDREQVGEHVHAASFAEGLLTDRFDAVALNYAGYDDDGQVVGSMRVVPDGPLGLPLEECWPLNGFRAGKRMAEMGRFATAMEYRGTRQSLLLTKAGWQGARRLGVSHVLVDTYVDDTQGTHAAYQRLGFVPLGDTYEDSRYAPREPSLVMAVECEPGEEALPSHLQRFFRADDPSIDHDDGGT